MRVELDLEVQVAGRRAAEPGAALPGQAQVLAGADALRDVDVERALLQRDAAVGASTAARAATMLRSAPRYASSRSISTLAWWSSPLRAAAPARARPPAARARAAEQRLEEVAGSKLGAAERPPAPNGLAAAAAELEAGVPVRRRLEVLAGLVQLLPIWS